MNSKQLNEMIISKALLSDASEIAKIHVDTWRTQYQRILSQKSLESASYEKRKAIWTKLLTSPQPLWHLFVAKDGQQKVVGFSAGGKNRNIDAPFDGEVYAIYLLKEHQGMGIGKKLLLKTFSQFLVDGFKSCSLSVLEKNPSRKFYEGLGGEFYGRKTVDIAGDTYTEVVYGWHDLSFVNSLQETIN